MSYTVKAVADVAGVSVRTLHHYDRIGLLRPAATSPAGYRLYSEADLERLQQVLFFRELGFSLQDVKAIVDRPTFDRTEALRAHRRLLVEQQGRLGRLVELVDRTIASIEKGAPMSNQERFGAFDDAKLRRGKVRDVYDLGDEVLLVASDRLSAFDVVLPTPIPGKGAVLTQLSAFWFGKTADLIENHLLSADPYPDDPALRGRAMLCRKAERLDVECVARGYLAGSAWAEYRRAGTIGGQPAPAGLRESAELPEPLFTPTTKAETGHDLPMRYAEVEALVGRELAARLREVTLNVYAWARAFARERGDRARRHQARARSGRRGADRDRRAADPRLVPLLAGRPVPGRAEPGQLRQAVPARLPGGERVGQAATRARAAPGGGRAHGREVPRGLPTPGRGRRGLQPVDRPIPVMLLRSEASDVASSGPAAGSCCRA